MKSERGSVELMLLLFSAFALVTQTLLFQELMNHRTTQQALQAKMANDYHLEGALAESVFLLQGFEELPGDLNTPSVYFPGVTIRIETEASTITLFKKNQWHLRAGFTGSGNSVRITSISSLSNYPYSR